MAVGDVEKRERRNRRVDVYRVQPCPENALRHTPVINLLHGGNGIGVERLNALALPQIVPALDVFVHHQTDEVFVVAVVVIGELNQFLQRLHRRQVVQVQVRLDGPHASISLFEHRQVQAVLAAEVVIDHPLAGARGRCNGVDARAGEAFVGELVRGHSQDLGHGAGGVVGATGFFGRIGFIALANRFREARPLGLDKRC